MASLVSLELDEEGKENLQGLQQEIGKAEVELQQTQHKLRVRNAEAKHAALTLAELEVVPDEVKSYEQVGKMFLLKPLPELKAALTASVESASKDVASLTEKKNHQEEAYKKVRDDFQEFVKAHTVEAKEGDDKKE